MKKIILTVFIISATLLSLLLGGCSKNVTPAGQTIEVERGDLDIVVSADGSLTAHWEHSVAITEGEALILTLP